MNAKHEWFADMHSMNPTAIMERAAIMANDHYARKEAEHQRAVEQWKADSDKRAKESNLHAKTSHHIGRLDDTYIASDVPLTIGWNHHEDGPSLAYVALGGVDVTAYLPPDVLADIKGHIDSCWEDGQ